MGEQDIILQPDLLRSIASSTVSGTYAAVSTPLSFAVRIIKFTNNSTMDVTLSWDGVHDHEYIPSGSFLLLDVAANKELVSACWIRVGTQFYVKGTAGTGNFYISTYYA